MLDRVSRSVVYRLGIGPIPGFTSISPTRRGKRNGYCGAGLEAVTSKSVHWVAVVFAALSVTTICTT